MKSERRHELQQNELADMLGRFIKKAEPYTPIALTAVIALVIAVLAIGYFQSRAATQRSDATLLYLLNSGQGDPAALGDIAASYPNTKPAQLAKLAQADAYLGQGIEAMFTDRELATTGLQDAVAIYEDVFGSAEEEIIRSRAALGMARAHEALGESDDAIEWYQQVIEIRESDEMVKLAEQRIKSLQRVDTQEFLAWFGEQSPQSMDPSLPPDMPDSGGLPGMPDISIPDFSTGTDEPLQLPSSDDEATAPEVPDGEATEEGQSEEPSSEGAPSETTAPAQESDSDPAERAAAADEASASAGEESAADKTVIELSADENTATPASEDESVSEDEPVSEDDPAPADDASETK